jgi:hypothetical protein
MARTLNSTTLSAAVPVDEKRVTLASNSTVKVGHLLFSGKEAMLVNGPGIPGSTLASGDVAEVQRGYAGTKPQAHASGAKVWTGPGSDFSSIKPTGLSTTAAELVLPRVVLPDGLIYNLIDGEWVLNQDDPVRSEGNYGTVTQATSITTGVTVNARAGRITTVSQTVAAAAEADIVVTNSEVNADDIVVVCIKTHTSAGTFHATVSAVADGSFTIRLANLHASAAGDNVLVISFRVFKQASN